MSEPFKNKCQVEKNYSPDRKPSRSLLIGSTFERYLSEAMNSFQNDIEEVSLVMDGDKMTIKNYVEYDNGKI
jgi:hypothetical protein